MNGSIQNLPTTCLGGSLAHAHILEKGEVKQGFCQFFYSSSEQNMVGQSWSMKKPVPLRKKPRPSPLPLNILMKNLKKNNNPNSPSKGNGFQTSSPRSDVKNINSVGCSTVENSRQSLHLSLQFTPQICGSNQNIGLSQTSEKFQKNKEICKQNDIDSRVLEKNSIKIDLFREGAQTKPMCPIVEGHYFSQNKEKRAYSPQNNHRNLFFSQNMGKAHGVQVKTIKKLISSAEISKMHNHFGYYQNLSSCRQNSSPETRKQGSQETIDSLSTKKSVPNFLSRKDRRTEEVPRILQKNQIVNLKVVSQGNEEVTASLQVLKLLADNATTTVYLVRELRTNFLFCLKKCQIRNDPSEFDFLVREGKFGAKLDHPSLLKTYCTLYDSENIYQLMEYMEGSTLFDKTHQQRCNIANKKSWKLSAEQTKIKSMRLVLGSILDAVQYMHSQGVIHRDIKPSNIFISHDYTFKIGDFGSCGRLGCKQFVGTLDYVTPEVLLRSRYNEKVDLWSIGCIAYELWTGIPPFYHQKRQTTIHNIINKQMNHEVIDNPALLNFLTKLLDKDASRRMPAGEALSHPFLQQQVIRVPE